MERGKIENETKREREREREREKISLGRNNKKATQREKREPPKGSRLEKNKTAKRESFRWRKK